MHGRLGALRLCLLIFGLTLASCLPGVAADWLMPARSTDSVMVLPLPTEALPHQLDIRGNEIVRPVERYGIDPQGALYEMHSPQTEVPRLDPPEL